jgi:hypothetical protein
VPPPHAGGSGRVASPPDRREICIPECGLEGGSVRPLTGGIHHRRPRRKGPEVKEGVVRSAASSAGIEFKARQHTEEDGFHSK